MHVCACACVSCCVCMCVCVFVCVYVCGAGAHVCRAPGAVQECRAPGVVQECHAPGLGCMCVMLQVLGLVLQVLGMGKGLGRGRGLLRPSLFTHPQNCIFANPGQPRSLKINIY